MNNQNEKSFVLERVFDAPKEKVWKAWTTPEMVKKWWGPNGFSCPVANIDFTQGGKYLFCMRNEADSKDYWSTGEYEKIEPMERIVVSDSFADAEGNRMPASYYGMGSDWPTIMNIQTTFDEVDGKTKLTIKYDNLAGFSEKDFQDMNQGWNESLDKLEKVLA
ncbi:MAG: hypothetical protein ACD_14C00017G0003 [uncultured bacterium]|nr:MAG: hypothetical protein ACD_14C00017G0003 [uncultured bacterium]KKQ45200.1 MAG: hypothetical protein US63_C0020G0024 [Candidatus Moranbacteria bacterium GW2011_GWC2_37_8]KKQ60966.1 MAG: hypothetical protein US82_C0026G0025 [Parcubacteria group bacterium GW2011_GWC1_38_22]